MTPSQRSPFSLSFSDGGAFQVTGARVAPWMGTVGTGIDVRANDTVRMGVALEAAKGDHVTEGRVYLIFVSPSNFPNPSQRARSTFLLALYLRTNVPRFRPFTSNKINCL